MELMKVEGTCSLKMLRGNDSEVGDPYGQFRNRHAFAAWLRQYATNSLKAIQLQTAGRNFKHMRRYRRCGFRTITRYSGNTYTTSKVRIMILKMPKGARVWANKYS